MIFSVRLARHNDLVELDEPLDNPGTPDHPDLLGLADLVIRIGLIDLVASIGPLDYVVYLGLID